jgi:HAD superfamily hydrolase (TIGR01459 family)
MLKIFNTILEAAKDFPAVLLDAYGVFWGGNSFGPLPGSAKAMEKLVSSGKIVGVLSNATQLASQEVEKLKKHGLFQNQHFHFFISSGEITRHLFLQQKLPFQTPRNTFYLVGEPHPKLFPEAALFEKSTYIETENIEEADFLYVRVPHVLGEDQVDPEVFRKEIERLPVKAPMICANPDLFAHEGIPPRAVVRQGSIAAIYQALGGTVYYTGKPDPLAYFTAMSCFKQYGITEKKNVLMVGDNPSTDILGAKAFGMSSALILETGLMGDRTNAFGKEAAIANLEEEELPSFFIKTLG